MRPRVALGAAVLCLGASVAAARPARCFSTDDGYFACDFRTIDKGGSFTVSAPGRPGYTLYVDGPGKALGYLETGGRSVALPGDFIRRKDDPACWTNTETKVSFCAW